MGIKNHLAHRCTKTLYGLSLAKKDDIACSSSTIKSKVRTNDSQIENAALLQTWLSDKHVWRQRCVRDNVKVDSNTPAMAA